MRAAKFTGFGPIEGIRVVEVQNPEPGDGIAIVRVEAASINPSDLKNIGGAMVQTTLPRIPGRDYAGVVESGPADWVGARVWGTGGDIGFTCDGTHAERIVVPTASLSRMPDRLRFGEAASVGVNFVTAWCGIVEAASIRRGETLLVIGAGGVGGAAAQIAHRLGTSVIAADRTAPATGSHVIAVSDHLLVGAADLPSALRQATGGRGADVVFDTVGGAMFRTALTCLARGGRLIEISAANQREVSFDLADFYHNESRLFGVDSLKRDTVQAGRILTELFDGFESRGFRPAPIAATLPLSRVVEAYNMVAAGARGRIVIHPNH